MTSQKMDGSPVLAGTNTGPRRVQQLSAGVCWNGFFAMLASCHVLWGPAKEAQWDSSQDAVHGFLKH